MKSSSKAIFLILLVTLLALPVISVAASGAEQARQFSLPVLVVNTGALNVRSGPGPQYTVVTSVPGGTELPVLGTNQDNTWYLVATVVGTGWVDVSFTLPRGDFTFVPLVRLETLTALAAQPVPNDIGLPEFADLIAIPQLEAPTIIVNTGRLNVRSGPGPQFSIIGSVPGGTSFDALGVTGDGTWYLVDGALGRGWVAAEFTIFRGVFDNIPVILSAF
jgi:N-acetylmuramoyl-L-alanine amidase